MVVVQTRQHLITLHNNGMGFVFNDLRRIRSYGVWGTLHRASCQWLLDMAPAPAGHHHHPALTAACKDMEVRVVSESTVGRIIHDLKAKGKLPHSNKITLNGRTGALLVREPKPKRKKLRRKGFVPQLPGDVVQLDTLDLRPLPGVLLKHFTAHDVVCKWNVMGVYRQASATIAAHFLDSLEQRMPFSVRAIQVDGGSEFESMDVCQRRGIRLFVLPPRSPKLNGSVERAHRTHTKESYEVTDSTFELAELRQNLLEWETTYNTARPHQALGYLTPVRFLDQQRKEVRCH